MIVNYCLVHAFVNRRVECWHIVKCQYGLNFQAWHVRRLKTNVGQGVSDAVWIKVSQEIRLEWRQVKVMKGIGNKCPTSPSSQSLLGTPIIRSFSELLCLPILGGSKGNLKKSLRDDIHCLS